MSTKSQDMIYLRRSELETLLEEAACLGARKALREVGLADEEAAHDIRTLRAFTVDQSHAAHVLANAGALADRRPAGCFSRRNCQQKRG